MLSIRDCRDLLRYYRVVAPPTLRKLKEKTMSIFMSKICQSNLPCPCLARRQSKNFRMTRKQRLSFYLI